ncbi:hypothetical protein GALMADRAFT_243495, partial [Galerina marginata CBS 339.88]
MPKTLARDSLNLLNIPFIFLNQKTRLRLPVVLIPLVIFSLLRTVDASLYPTKPVASTVYTAGTPAQVVWMEDG